jgi:tetratricopeptide (TPR) repeat protein
MFSNFFTTDAAYESASSEQKDKMIEQWMLDAASNNFDTRTKAIAQLGNVRAAQALDILMQVAEEPMKNYRPKWMAIRAIGRIGDMQAVPMLIDFVDNGNTNTGVYARAALAEITGVYFGSDKDKWRQWQKDYAKNVTPAQKTASEMLSRKGWELWGKCQFQEAEQKFRQATAKDPTNTNAWSGFGWSQFKQGKSLAAKNSFERCIELEPDHPAALNGLGWIAKGQGKVDEAIGYWEKAVKAAPAAIAALGGLTQTYMELKQYDDAIRYYEMWLKVEPDNKDAQEGLKKAEAAKTK